MRLVFGADYAGSALRDELSLWAKSRGIETLTVGAVGTDSYDYPDAADLVSAQVDSGTADAGVLCCGTGIGVSIRANRHLGIRAANCTTVQMAELSRQHNHANVLCLGARILTSDQAVEILQAF